MNAKKFEKRLKEISELPKQSPEHEKALRELAHQGALSFVAGFTSKNTARRWGRLMREAESYPGEAELDQYWFYAARN